MFERIAYNILQVLVVACAPLLDGIVNRLKENFQSKRCPSIVQPYRDIWKLLHKDKIVSEHSSWSFRAAPYVAFAGPVFVALLVPVLTRYPLFSRSWATCSVEGLSSCRCRSRNLTKALGRSK